MICSVRREVRTAYSENHDNETTVMNNENSDAASTSTVYEDANNVETAFPNSPTSMKDLHHRDYWITDTGATTHLTFDSYGMVNSEE